VQCLLDEGFLHFICNPAELVGYWDQLLRDFPQHPASQRRNNSFPISLYGDEGSALNASWMTFHFQCDLSPALTNAGVSRFLITTIPSTLYIYDQEGVNLTLQSAARSITESLNKLSTDGVVVRDRSTGEVCAFHGFVVNFKGDWKYLAQLFNMTKTAQKEEVCWKCGATKGTNDPELCYVNLSPDAPWRAVVTPPWTQRPAYADLVKEHYWHGANIELRLARASGSL
ncbi:unnamed protein product, partial [Durusdinium trenchii]